jgi:hypothetical protein
MMMMIKMLLTAVVFAAFCSSNSFFVGSTRIFAPVSAFAQLERVGHHNTCSTDAVAVFAVPDDYVVFDVVVSATTNNTFTFTSNTTTTTRTTNTTAKKKKLDPWMEYLLGTFFVTVFVAMFLQMLIALLDYVIFPILAMMENKRRRDAAAAFRAAITTARRRRDKKRRRRAARRAILQQQQQHQQQQQDDDDELLQPPPEDDYDELQQQQPPPPPPRRKVTKNPRQRLIREMRRLATHNNPPVRRTVRLRFAADETLVKVIPIPRARELPDEDFLAQYRAPGELRYMANKNYDELHYYTYDEYVAEYHRDPRVHFNLAEAQRTAARLAAEVAAGEVDPATTAAAARPVVVAVTEERRYSRRLRAKPRVSYARMC